MGARRNRLEMTAESAVVARDWSTRRLAHAGSETVAPGNWVGQRDLHPHRRRHRARCCCYIMANMKARNSERGARNRHRDAVNDCSAFRVPHSALELALSRGFAPRAFSFAGRRAGLLHLESKSNAERGVRSAEQPRPARPVIVPHSAFRIPRLIGLRRRTCTG